MPDVNRNPGEGPCCNCSEPVYAGKLTAKGLACGNCVAIVEATEKIHTCFNIMHALLIYLGSYDLAHSIDGLHHDFTSETLPDLPDITP